jgi:hypothetical protein
MIGYNSAMMKTRHVSFTSKLGVAAAILLFEAALIGGFWWAGSLSDASDPVASELPPLATLTETSGKVIGFTTSRRRIRTYHAPIVEFSADGRQHQVSTRAMYNREAIPFNLGDAAPILYDRASPESAWLKWEYERLVQEAATPRFADIMAKFATWAAYGLVGVTVALLLLYFVTPIKDKDHSGAAPASPADHGEKPAGD